VDRSLISALYAQAVAEGEDRDWLDDVFGRSVGKGIVQHERRHKDHLHVRFYNPRAQEHGRIVYPVLVETGAAPPPTVKHRVRRGETLGGLARRYGTSVSALRAANGLRSTRLRAGRSYTIPIRRMPPDEGPVLVPPRRLPPERVATAAATAAPETTASEGPPDAAARAEGATRRIHAFSPLCLCLAVVFATYNPEGVSYYHWLRVGEGPAPLKAFLGVVLLIAWVFLLRTAWSSLGTLGLVLTAAFFGTLLWVVLSFANVVARGSRAITYLVGFALAAVLSVGLGWARTRQKVTGQVDVD
jgi:LysM repeat protein